MTKDKILAGFLMLGVAGSYVFGGSFGCASGQEYEKDGKVCNMQNSKTCMLKMHDCRHFGEMHFMKRFMMSLHSISLSKDQMKQIGGIMQEGRKSIQNPLDAFDEDKFDTQKFIDTMQNQKSQMLKHQAEVIAKVYAVLTPDQKRAVLSDLKQMQMKGKCDTSPSRGR